MPYVGAILTIAIILGYTAFTAWYAWKTWWTSSRLRADFVPRRRNEAAMARAKVLAVVLVVLALLMWAFVGMVIYAVTHIRINIGHF